MFLSTMRARLNGGLLFLGAGAIALLVAVSLGVASGADHRDSPGAEADKAADITDVYAFRSGDNLVIAVGVNGLTAPADNAAANFSNDVTYTVHVDKDANLATDEATVKVNFSGSGDQQQFSVSGLGANPITGPVTSPSTAANPAAPKITETGGIKVFAGQRDDAFFFDLTAFKKFVAGPYVPAAGLRAAADGAPADTFKGTNVSYIVLELPVTAVTGAANANTGIIRAWANTTRGANQIDRMAIPAINTALIPSDQKENFNKGNPGADAATFQATGKTTTDGLRGAVDAVLGAPNPVGGPLGDLTSTQVAGALIPDIVTIDFSKAVVFPNGRRLQDDVIDAALGIVLNRGGATGVPDAIGANDKTFDASFPFLAAPHQPAAAPSGLPSTGGDTGNTGGDGTTVAIVLAAIAGMALMAAGGTMVIARRRA